MFFCVVDVVVVTLKRRSISVSFISYRRSNKFSFDVQHKTPNQGDTKMYDVRGNGASSAHFAVRQYQIRPVLPTPQWYIVQNFKP